MLRLPEVQPVSQDVIPLAGGLDQITSSYSLQPGALRDVLNFACKPQGGYYRVPGYERFDGRFEPHLAEFITLAFTLAPSKTISVGDAGTFGNYSGVVAYVDPFGKYIALTKVVTSTFIPGDIIVGGDTKGVATGLYTQLDIKALAVIKASAANIYRADIAAVPGSGPIRGIVMLNDIVYAFRDNVGGTACGIYKSSSSGWTAVPLNSSISFDEFSSYPPIGESGTITQGGVTATYSRIVIDGAGTTPSLFKGRAIITSVTGGSLATGAFTTSHGGSGTFISTVTPISLLPGGSYKFSIGNFKAQASSNRIYGADSVNDGFEFDGVSYVPIPIAGTSVKPSIAIVHSNHLFFAVDSSLIHSAIGEPYNMEVINGAGEIGTGGEITGMTILPGSQSSQALLVTARNSTWILYGTDTSDWNFTNFNVGIGAVKNTVQNLFDVFSLDDRGVTMMKQSLNYGNFDSATITYNIQKFIESNRGDVTCSGLSRENSQYRVYFNNGYGLYITATPQGVVGHGIVLLPDAPLTYFNGERSTGETVSLFGDANGVVYRNDIGTSFDGKKISAYFNTNINSAKSPRIRKRFRRCVLELQGSNYVDMQVGYMFEWSTPNILPHQFEKGNIEFATLSFWDSFIWDAFFWDGRTHDVVSVELNGSGENLQLMVVSNVNYSEEFIVSSALFQFSPRRINR